MFWIGYRFFVFLFELAISIHSVWNVQSRNFLSGRKNQDLQLRKWLMADRLSVIQIHCASLGEFELSLPLYEKLKEQYPQYKFLFTFFSPSGYQHAKIPQGCAKSYLPLDTKKKVQTFIKLIQPSMVIFIKYEYWFQYLSQLIKQNIPFGYVNVNQQEMPFNLKFKTAKKLLHQASFIYTSNDKTFDQLKANDLPAHDNFLDLRYTKSIQIHQENYKPNSNQLGFLNHDRTIICGSVWKEDIEIIKPLINIYKNFNWVLAPHRVDKAMINYIQNHFPTSSLFSKKQTNSDSNVLIVDTIGDLKYLYRFGSLNYVGGAFNTGLHNVLEPVATGAPLVFGPEYKAYPEANRLKEKGIAYSIKNSKEFEDIIKKLENGSLHLNSMEWLDNMGSDLENMTHQIGKNL